MISQSVISTSPFHFSLSTVLQVCFPIDWEKLKSFIISPFNKAYHPPFTCALVTDSPHNVQYLTRRIGSVIFSDTMLTPL